MKIKSLLFSLLVLSSLTLNVQAGTTTGLFEFELGPRVPVAGAWMAVYIHPNMKFQRDGYSRVILNARVDGVATALIHPVSDLWLYTSGPSNISGQHVISVDYFLENPVVADSLKAAINELDSEISLLETALLIEEDLDKQVVLQSAIDAKKLDRDGVIVHLDQARLFVGTQDFNFAINN